MLFEKQLRIKKVLSIIQFAAGEQKVQIAET
jgi:hypothetical protein